MPSRVGLAPWFLVLFWVLRLGLPLMLLVMTIDALRRRPTHFPRSWFSGRTGWVVENILLLVVMLVVLLGFVTALGPVSTLIGLAFVPAALVHGLRYLLTVVYPSPKRLAERESRERDAE